MGFAKCPVCGKSIVRGFAGNNEVVVHPQCMPAYQAGLLNKVPEKNGGFYMKDLKKEASKDAMKQLQSKQTKVMDAGVFWDDIKTKNGWKLQKNTISQHCRILDPNSSRIASGSEEKMTTYWESHLSEMRK